MDYKIEIAKRLLKMKLDINQKQDATELSLEEIKQISFEE